MTSNVGADAAPFAFVRLSLRSTRLAILGALLTLSIVSCVPSTTTAAFTETYDGPIETVALVLEPADDYNSQPFEKIAYDRTLTGFYQHPYGRSRFDVVERERIDDVVNEFGLVQTGATDSVDGPRLGELVGAQYVLYVDLTNLSAEYVSSSGISLGGISLGGSGYRASAQVTLTLVDTETGIIVARSTGGAEDLVGDSLSVMGTSATLGDEEGAILSVLPKAISTALNDLFRTLAS